MNDIKTKAMLCHKTFFIQFHWCKTLEKLQARYESLNFIQPLFTLVAKLVV